MYIGRNIHLQYAALIMLTTLTLVEIISAAGTTPRPWVDYIAERKCQRQETRRKDEYPETVPTIYDRVAPAVVSIHAVSINPYRLTERVNHSVGSGFIISLEGSDGFGSWQFVDIVDTF